MTFTLNGKTYRVDLGKRRVEYRVRYSRQATRCRIRVRPDGVEVLLPKDAAEERADSFLRENSSWVLDQLAFIRRMGGVRGKSRKNENRILLRGLETAVIIVEEDTARGYGIVEEADDALRVRMPRSGNADPWQALESWLRRPVCDR